MAWNRPIERDQGSWIRDQGARKFPFRGLIAGVIVVVGAAVAAWWLLSDSKPPLSTSTSTSTSLIKEAAAAAAKRGETPRQHETERGETLRQGEEARGERTRPDEEKRGEVARQRERSAMSNPSDQLLVMALGSGDDVPPLPIDASAERDFRESLKREIVIDANDSEEVKALKERVIAAREAIKAELAAGRTVQQVLQEHEEQANFAAGVRRELMVEARRILESGDREGAQKYVTMMNLALQQIGVEQIEMPLTREERRQRALERKLEKEESK